MLTENEIRRYDRPNNFPQSRLLLSDRGGLALDVLPSGVRSWVYRYRRQDGKRMKMVLGRYPDLSLKAAREERDKLAGLVARGQSPAEERQKERFEEKEREEGRGSDPTLAQFTAVIGGILSRYAAAWITRFFLLSETSRSKRLRRLTSGSFSSKSAMLDTRRPHCFSGPC
jgi:hypothetical protein